MKNAHSISREAFYTLAEANDNSLEGTAYTVISRQVPADMETPVSALQKIRRGEYCFLLESVERGDQVGRYSFLGTDPHIVLTYEGGTAYLADPTNPSAVEEKKCSDPLGELERILAMRRLIVPEGTKLPRFVGGAVGYAGYEVACSLEPVSPAANDPYGLPDLAYALYDTVLVFDHVQRTAQIVTLAPLNDRSDEEYEAAVGRIEQIMLRLRSTLPMVHGDGNPAGDKTGQEVKSNLTQAEYEAMVERAREHMFAGDIIQVVLSQRFERETSADPFTIYRALRMVNPSPYMVFMQFGDACIVGASPEMLVQAQHGRVVTHPIAGTRQRGRTHSEDDLLARELQADEKERAEHLMLVDLGRNDIGRISRIGSVKVPRFMEVERYSHVMHLVSNVEGELEKGLGAIDALRACFPAGTVSGAPKVRAMQIIAEQEKDRRGPYAGAVGYIGYDGNMDTAITIRTMIVRGGKACVQAGAGLVVDSVPSSEYQETLNKARGLLSAIDLAEEIEQQEMLIREESRQEVAL